MPIGSKKRHRQAPSRPAAELARRLAPTAGRSPSRSSISRTEAFRPPESRRERLTGKQRRPEMAPQRLEKIESAPGIGSASEASDPQDLVPGRAAARAAPSWEPQEWAKSQKTPDALKSLVAKVKSPVSSFRHPNATANLSGSPKRLMSWSS